MTVELVEWAATTASDSVTHGTTFPAVVQADDWAVFMAYRKFGFNAMQPTYDLTTQTYLNEANGWSVYLTDQGFEAHGYDSGMVIATKKLDGTEGGSTVNFYWGTTAIEGGAALGIFRSSLPNKTPILDPGSFTDPLPGWTGVAGLLTATTRDAAAGLFKTLPPLLVKNSGGLSIAFGGVADNAPGYAPWTDHDGTPVSATSSSGSDSAACAIAGSFVTFEDDYTLRQGQARLGSNDITHITRVALNGAGEPGTPPAWTPNTTELVWASTMVEGSYYDDPSVSLTLPPERSPGDLLVVWVTNVSSTASQQYQETSIELEAAHGWLTNSDGECRAYYKFLDGDEPDDFASYVASLPVYSAILLRGVPGGFLKSQTWFNSTQNPDVTDIPAAGDLVVGFFAMPGNSSMERYDLGPLEPETEVWDPYSGEFASDYGRDITVAGFYRNVEVSGDYTPPALEGGATLTNSLYAQLVFSSTVPKKTYQPYVVHRPIKAGNSSDTIGFEQRLSTPYLGSSLVVLDGCWDDDPTVSDDDDAKFTPTLPVLSDWAEVGSLRTARLLGGEWDPSWTTIRRDPAPVTGNRFVSVAFGFKGEIGEVYTDELLLTTAPTYPSITVPGVKAGSAVCLLQVSDQYDAQFDTAADPSGANWVTAYDDATAGYLDAGFAFDMLIRGHLLYVTSNGDVPIPAMKSPAATTGVRFYAFEVTPAGGANIQDFLGVQVKFLDWTGTPVPVFDYLGNPI